MEVILKKPMGRGAVFQ